MNRWIDGLGRYGGDISKMLNGSSGQAWAQVDGGFSLSSANPRTGSWCLRQGSGASTAQWARRVFGAPLTEVLLGRAIFCHSLPTFENFATTLWSLRDQSNGEQLNIILGTDGAIDVHAGGTSTSLGRSDPCIGAGAYQHIELYAKAGNGTGAIEIRVDEVTKLNLTGLDTIATSNVEFSQFRFGYAGAGGTAMIDHADFYCNDTVDDGSGCDWFIGDCKSGIRLVNADTAQADFALSAGSQGYPLLGQAPADDATYVSTTATAAESDFGIEAGPGNLSEILTVRPFIRAMKDDAGTCTVAPNMKSSGIKGTVDDQPITSAFAYYDSNVPTDPATGVPWTPSGLAAALEVVERVT